MRKLPLAARCDHAGGSQVIIDTVQRWELGRESRRPAGDPIRTSEYDVIPLDTWSVARDFVATHHYAGDTSPTSHSFGLYRRAELAGVALFGPPASMNAHRFVWPTLTIDQAVTLGRLVLLEDVPGNGESWFVARCFEHLADRGIIGVESCADPAPRTTLEGEPIHRGHLGIVYQALNAQHTGHTNRATLRLLPDGTCLSNRSAGKVVRGERGAGSVVAKLMRWGADALRDGEDPLAWLQLWRDRLTRKMRHPGNFRYLWCLDRRRRREVLGRHKMVAYPKWQPKENTLGDR